MLTFKYRYRKQIILGAIVLVIILSSSIFLYNKSNTKKKKPEKTGLVLAKKESSNEKIETNTKEVLVDIKGEVIVPGTYTLKANSRVKDVIAVAGGLSVNADTSVINLSKKVTDEMVIIIYSYDEVSNFKQTKELENTALKACSFSEDLQLKNDACIESEKNTLTSETTQVSLNTATLEQLMTLSGIGESKAQEIINYREKNGGFKTIEELKNVSGIGDSTYDKIKDSITL